MGVIPEQRKVVRNLSIFHLEIELYFVLKLVSDTLDNLMHSNGLDQKVKMQLMWKFK